ncbi:MAG: hypothetical protein CMM08_12355 [Rhodospirillaceae bacterium]|nr:hypothetical protein [Rhodospirillaceae bacterium]MDP6623691.1 caspase family protein [Alphaproteobacteria bacterium]
MRCPAIVAALVLTAIALPSWAAEKNAPVIEVPAQVELSDGVLQLKGRITDQSRVVFATLDGQPIAIGPEGAIVLNKAVVANATQAMVTALDEWGNRSERTIRLTRAQAKPDLAFGNYHALVIGNNEYAALPKLKTAVSDATAVAAMLKGAYGFDTMLLKNATRSDVIGAMAKLRGKLKPSDNLLIYFAGHGVLDSYAEEGFWLPVDAAKDNPANWISNADVTNMLRAIRAKHVMVVADSCFSGTLVRAAPVKIKTAEERTSWLQRMAAKRSRTALVSGGLEPVMDAGGGNHSVFAKAFLEALSENREVTDGQTLFATIRRPVALESDQTPDYADIRRAGHDGGDFLFVRRSAAKLASARATVASSTRRQTTAPVAPAAANRQVELAFWNSIKNSKTAAEYQAYLEQYPRGAFAPLARQRIAALNKKVAPKPVARATPVARPAPPQRSPRQRFDGTWKATLFAYFAAAGCPMDNKLEVRIQNGKLSGSHRGNRLSAVVDPMGGLKGTYTDPENDSFEMDGKYKGREIKGYIRGTKKGAGWDPTFCELNLKLEPLSARVTD